MNKKVILIFVVVSMFGLGIFGYAQYQEHGKIIPFIEQLSKNKVGDNVDIQPLSQKTANYVGSDKSLTKWGMSQWTK